MDAFYASVEQRDVPAIQGRPVVVGGNPEGRGVVAAASYEARAHGIRSAMPMRTAMRLCPQAVRIPPDFEKYQNVSKCIHGIFHEYTDLIEPIALDEAYLDVTHNKPDIPFGHRVARMIKAQIRADLQLTASAGVAPNKFLAKIASDLDKPDGLVVVMPHQVTDFLQELPVGRIPGVGKVTREQLEQIGIHTIGQLASSSPPLLASHVGRRGAELWKRAQGIDDSPVQTARDPKQLSAETTFTEDLHDVRGMQEALAELSLDVATRLQGRHLTGRIVTIKVRYPDFETITRSQSQGLFLDAPQPIRLLAVQLLQRTDAARRGVRLLGVGVSGFPHSYQSDPPPGLSAQLDLFDGAGFVG
ncbi:MAG: DNA polymerase IV [Gemmatimonadetes bacterium]|nr:DNA polymerase IV [Gemmatimonadota bacterium]MBT6146893.1 DNA polymerase IV [Gemmatimonadota bacterium]MBT7861528.1 DNA polymerase IV [Gemmatimonadota bacterium]